MGIKHIVDRLLQPFLLRGRERSSTTQPSQCLLLSSAQRVFAPLVHPLHTRAGHELKITQISTFVDIILLHTLVILCTPLPFLCTRTFMCECTSGLARALS